jgi:hypothetical protein
MVSAEECQNSGIIKVCPVSCVREPEIHPPASTTPTPEKE